MTPRSDPTTWLALEEHDAFVVRITESARELRFAGPGRVRPCGDDGAYVASGTVMSLPSGGEAPGGEQWVATPCGTFRWIGGVHKITVRASECMVQTSTGTLFLVAGAGSTVAEDAAALDGGGTGRAVAGTEGAWRLDGRIAVRVAAKAPWASPSLVAEARTACTAAEKRSEALAARIREIDGGSLAPLGALTAEHVEAKRASRAACGVSVARAALAGTIGR